MMLNDQEIELQSFASNEKQCLICRMTSLSAIKIKILLLKSNDVGDGA